MYTSFIIVHLPPPPVVSSHLALDLSRSPQQVAGSRSDTVQMNRQMKQREQNTEPEFPPLRVHGAVDDDPWQGPFLDIF